jgi:plastocyanin
VIRGTVAAFAVAALALSGCGSDDGAAGDATPTTAISGPVTDTSPSETPADVVIDTFLFEPNAIAVSSGATITFRNDDDILHTVTQGTRDEPVAEGFDLQLDGVGASGEVSVTGPGAVNYFCSIHAGMDAEITVG